MKHFMVLALLFLIAGIMSGQYLSFTEGIALCAFITLLSAVICIKRKAWLFILMPVFVFMGLFSIVRINSPKDLYVDSLAENGNNVIITCLITNVTVNSNGAETIIGELETIDGNPVDNNIKIKSYTNLKGFSVGRQAVILGSFDFLKFGKTGEFNEYRYYKSRGVDYSVTPVDIAVTEEMHKNMGYCIFALKNKVNDILDYALTEDTAGVAKAMITGDKQDVDDGIRDLYSIAGISHVLAISGLHMGLFWMIIKQGLNKTKLNQRQCFVVCSALSLMFAAFTGMSPSGVRAVIMLMTANFASVIGRRNDRFNSIAFAALVILIANPLYLWDTGFQLSFIMVAAVYLAGDVANEFKGKEKAFVTALVIWAVSIPVSAFYFYRVSIVGLIANIVLIFLMKYVVLGCFAVIACGFIWPALSVFEAGVVVGLLKFYSMACLLLSKLPMAKIDTGSISIPAFLSVIAVYAVIYFYKRKDRYFVPKLIAALSAAVIFIVMPRFGNDIEVAMVDVGQGDGIVITTADKKTIVVDTGGNSAELGRNTGAKKLYPYLKYKGSDKIDMLFISHMDRDHAYGALELMELVDIDNIILSKAQDEDNQLYIDFMAKAEERNIAVSYINAGDYIEIKEGFVIECIYPFEFTEGLGTNESSSVLRMDYGDISFLFTGDIGENEEKQIIASGQAVDTDVLKTAHHGSAYSSCEEFIEAVSPQVALISSGRNNVYGHPAEETVRRLEEAGAEIYNTAEFGRIIIKTDGKTIEVN